MTYFKLKFTLVIIMPLVSLSAFGVNIPKQLGNQKLDSMHYYHWDEVNLKWNFSSRVKFIYDTHGNIIQELNINWNEGKKQWVPRWKITFTYNDNRHLSQRLYYEWDKTIFV